MLAEIVEFLTNFRQHEASQSVYMCRTFLGRLVENHLTDVDKVAVSIKKGGSSSECFAFLQICELFLRDRTEVFLSAPASQYPGTPPLSRPEDTSDEEELAQTFLLWCLSRMLALLGHKKCDGLHEKTLDVVHQLLQTIKSRDLFFYGTVLRELILCISSLVQICDDFVTGRSEIGSFTQFHVPIDKVLKSLQEPAKRVEPCDIHLSATKLAVIDVDTCELFQLNFTKIMCKVSGDLSACCLTSKVNVLWAGLCCHLEFGDAKLKTETLRTLLPMMHHQAVPLEVEDYFIDCITALLELLLAGVEDFEIQEIEELERATADVITCLVTMGDDNFLSTYKSTLRNILFKMATYLEEHGLSHLHTGELKESVSGLLCEIEDRLSHPYLVSLVCKSQRSQLIAALISEIGTSTHLQYLIGPLVKVIMCDLTNQNVDSEADVTEGIQQTTSGEDTPKTGARISLASSKRKRKLDEESPRVTKVILRSSTYKVIKSKLDRFLQEDLQDNIVKQIEGVQVILELVSTCVSHFTGAEYTKHRLYKDYGQLWAWLSIENVNEICGFLFRVLQTLSTSAERSKMDINSCYTSAVMLIGALLNIQDCAEYDQDMFQTFAWVVSLPWLLNDPSWIDLKPTNSRDIVKIADRLVEHLDTDSICECLHVLALLPKDVASKWRTHVFRQALCDSNIEVKQAGISSFPYLLQHLGPNANHLVYDILHPCVSEKSDHLQQTLAQVAGPLACVICRKAVVNRSSVVSTNTPLYKRSTLGCMSCDTSTYCDVSGSPKERPKLVDANMFLPFLQLVHCGKSTVKLELINSMRCMFGHIGVRKNNVATINALNMTLVLIEDPDFDTRCAFSEVIQYLLGTSTTEGSEGTSELVLNKLRDAYCRAQKDNNNRLQKTVLLTIAQLGRISEGDLLVVVIIVLLESMLSPTPLIAAVAYEQLKTIAEYKKTKTQNLFMKCRHNVCNFLVDAMHNAQIGKINKVAEDILSEVSRVLGFPDIKSFLSGTEKYIVPYLVSKGTAAASSLIKMIATQLGVVSRSKLLIKNTKFVFSYLVRFKQEEAELQTAIHYLQKETSFELPDLLRIDFQRVHNELLLHLSTSYSQVFHGLTILSSYDKEYKGGRISTPEEMANYLQPRLLGVLAHFDSQLLNYSVPMEEKRPALESLISIIRLMGTKIISGIRHKVMNTLRIGLQFTDQAFIQISCKAWRSFVRSLELPFLGQMMAQIIATLLPLLKQQPKQVADIFNFMIVEHRVELKAHFHDIYFLPDMPELIEANTVLKQLSDAPSSQSDLKGRLVHSMKGIQHDSLDVRLHALSKLKNLLVEEKVGFSQLVVEHESADPVVSQLISVLLKGCREPEARAQRLYAECLGNCGAIDPGRLELSTNNPKAERAKFQPSIKEDNFAVALINEVVASYLAAEEPRIQDCSAFALQELLSIYNISESSEDERSHKLWSKFPEHIQEILIPHLTSRYILATDHDWSSLQKPIYCSSKKGNTFKDWVGTWTGYLMSKVKSDSKPYKVFKSCSAVIKFDIRIALYMLPYVVFHVLQDGSDRDIQEICAEINEVLDQVTRTDGKHKSSSNFHHLSTQTIFSVLDYLTKWKHFHAQTKLATGSKDGAEYLAAKVIDDFLERIPKDKLANVSFSCKAYTRALMQFEQFVKNKNQLSKEELDFMQRIYVELDEPDGVLGVAAIRQATPTLQEQILTYSGRLGCQLELQTCYEQAIQCDQEDLQNHLGLLRCLMDLGQPSQALYHASGVMAKRKEWTTQLTAYQIEAAWKLGCWSDLETYIKADKGSRSWPVVLGQLFLSAKDKKESEFVQQLQIARQDQMGPLSAASMEMGSYQRGYEYIVRLHMLNEIENLHMLMNTSNVETSDTGHRTVKREDILSQSKIRLKMMQSSFRIQEPLLTMRRTLMTLAQKEGEDNLDREIGHCWLASAKIAQKTGYLQTAYSFLLQASEFNLPEFCLQKAKWHWEKGENDQALNLLEREMKVHFGNIDVLNADQSETGKAKRQVYAKALLLYGRYSEETSQKESNSIVKQYREVLDVAPEWEDGYFYLGKYFDKIMTTLIEDKDDISKQGEFVVHVVKNLGLSLRYGNQFIYQSLPRMLSLWMDFGSSVVEQERKDKARTTPSTSQTLQKNRNNLGKLNSLICSHGKNIAPYQMFSAFSQLTSRICHAHPEVFMQLKAIIAQQVVSFPQQALWLLMAVSKSSYQMRAKRCQEIFAAARELQPSLQKVIMDYIKLTERLLELSEKNFGQAVTVSVQQHFRPLKRLLDDSKFSEVLLPQQSSMTVALPNTVDTSKYHNPFPGNVVYIKGFDDNIEILSSLARPKKITMLGSDGQRYNMMCKPKDDLRKDCRLMEFNGIVNKFLRKDPESRKRSLHIRTYTVTPLNDECGLLEWVNNTNGLRNILMKMYKERGMYVGGKTLKEMIPNIKESKEKKLHVYKQKLLPLHPPIFHEWFLRTFSDPTSWYNARLAYAKTTAVMSMVGYILGLGDRHGENILFDSKSGDCVHVDFNCLFNRGETFEWPEKVPFRMTHNLMHALGPLKLEGIFRGACEVTLRVMRKEIDPLMSILKPFVYDPLVEWKKSPKEQRQNPTDFGEITNDQAKVHVQNIEHRLRGILHRGSKRSLALSVEGHVNYLIQEATDEINLCQMYVGWAAYL